MTQVYIIRHAESEGNLYRRIHGHYDGLLTDNGLRQLVELEKRFKDISIASVYSSDLYRARRTAGAIYKPKGLELITMKELREINLGIWEDKCWGEVEDEFQEQLSYYNTSPDKWKIAGSEDYAQLQNRMLSAIRDIAAANDGKSVAVFTHGCAIRALICRIQNIPASEISRIQYCDNTAVTLLSVNGDDIKIEYMSDNSHLPKELSAFARETWWKEKSVTDGRNMRFMPMDLKKDDRIYLKCYRDAWYEAHDTYMGFTGIYLKWAKERSAFDPNLVSRAYLSGTPCGIIELEKSTELTNNTGHIAFLYLAPSYRGRGLGIQLVGYAVSYYRKTGVDKIRLKVSDSNKRALVFYRKYGFYMVGKENGALGTLCIMEKDISKTELHDE